MFRPGRMEQAHETPSDPREGGSTPFDIGKDANLDSPVRLEGDGSARFNHNPAPKGLRSDEVREGTLPDAETDFRVRGGPPDGDRWRTIEEVRVDRWIRNVGRGTHLQRAATRESQRSPHVAGHRTAVNTKRHVGDHNFPGATLKTHADQIVHQAATGKSS